MFLIFIPIIEILATAIRNSHFIPRNTPKFRNNRQTGNFTISFTTGPRRGVKTPVERLATSRFKRERSLWLAASSQNQSAAANIGLAGFMQ